MFTCLRKITQPDGSIGDGLPSAHMFTKRRREHDVTSRIRFRHQVAEASWSTRDARWSVSAKRLDAESRAAFTCNFLFMCSGYYSYEKGHQPAFPGIEHFAGTVVHPQAWPEHLDYSGKRVAVIGSGATAMTLVPAMTDQAARVTMIQRSPSYVISRPERDAINNRLRRFLSEKSAYAITRWKNILFQMYLYHRTRVAPESDQGQAASSSRQAFGLRLC